MADEQRAEYKATVDHRVVAGKVHLTLYATDLEGIESLRKLRDLLKEKTGNTCNFLTSVKFPNLAGLFIRLN